MIGDRPRKLDDTTIYHAFWADSSEHEAHIWYEFLKKISEHSPAPIYHYGSYEIKAIKELMRRYGDLHQDIKNRFINVNNYIYGKVYLPTYSNRLKDIGRFFDASWTSPQASGLQSLAWRYLWEETKDEAYQQNLTTYNQEDCRALKIILDQLSRISEHATSLSDVDFADKPKQHATEIGQQIHRHLDIILKLAQADYDIRKISLQQLREHVVREKKRGAPHGHPGYLRKPPASIDRFTTLPMRLNCPRDPEVQLQETSKLTQHVIIDLEFTGSGVNKVITKYSGCQGYCPKCRHYYKPIGITELQDQLFGHGFQAWVIYQRISLRLPYRIITQVLEEQFGEKITESTIVNFLRHLARYYCETEQLLIQHVLSSPFVHVDETKINILGTNQFVWVFTDGKHVFFKLTETREATIVHETLCDYGGILISDFYGGYDAVNCRQQKCWAHLIRDLNEDLWQAPFDTEFEKFVLQVKNLVLPIFEAAEIHGLRRDCLEIFKDEVDEFYNQFITGVSYKSEFTTKYQKRFIKYRESLFVFLEHDGISWNNNMAERALRHLAIQRKISGTFSDTVAKQYLLLLGIAQTCRFQEKSLLKFLLSKEHDVDAFQ